MDPVFQLKIDNLGSGWIDTTLTSDSGRFFNSCSYIDDSLSTLARVAADLADRHGAWRDLMRIHWFDGPGAYEWHLNVDEQAMLTLVVCWCREAFPTPDHPQQELFRGSIHARSCSSAGARAPIGSSAR